MFHMQRIEVGRFFTYEEKLIMNLSLDFLRATERKFSQNLAMH